jgi:hypothetical protein
LATTALQQIELDYLIVVEMPSQINYISCTSINQNLTMLANAGVNINDSVQVRNHLNIYYNRNYSYAAYSQVLNGCANQTLNYVLALPGIEAEEAKAGYRFGFNGHEKDDEVSGAGNTMTAMFWEYDARLGRRWNIDPKPITGISEYACFANNPIVFRDLNGDKIGEGKERAQKIKDVAGNKVKANNASLRSLNERIEKKESKGKTPETLYREREEIIENSINLKSMIKQVETLENDPNQVFNFLNSDNGKNETKYDVNTKAINFYTNGTVALDAHEMTHGYQYLKGDISFKTGGAPGLLYDVNDEIEAYGNQYLIDPTSVGFLISAENIKNMKAYSNLPLKRLDSRSTLESVYKETNNVMPSGVKPRMLYHDYNKNIGKNEVIK